MIPYWLMYCNSGKTKPVESCCHNYAIPNFSYLTGAQEVEIVPSCYFNFGVEQIVFKIPIVLLEKITDLAFWATKFNNTMVL